VLEPPSLADLDSWEGAMISSTSRLALPIDKLIVPKEGCVAQDTDRCRVFTNDVLCRRIAQLVQEQVVSHSVNVLDEQQWLQ
jgi:hypothetical protein